MYFRILSFCLVATLVACSGEDADPAGARQDMDVQADFAQDGLFEQLDGTALSLNDYRGRNVLLNYWATWCGPCIEEIPSLLNAAEELGDDYQLLLVSDEPAEKINEFLAEHGFEGPFIRLTEYFSQHGVKAVPSTLLFDAEGRQVRQWLGNKEWDSREMLGNIRDEIRDTRTQP